MTRVFFAALAAVIAGDLVSTIARPTIRVVRTSARKYGWRATIHTLVRGS